MMKRKVLVLGAFVATAMAAASGCGGGDEKPAATEATAAAPATTVAATATAPATTAATTTSTVATTTSSTRPTATVQQVASVLAREIPDWKSAVEGIGDCRLEILIGRCDVAQGHQLHDRDHDRRHDQDGPVRDRLPEGQELHRRHSSRAQGARHGDDDQGGGRFSLPGAQFDSENCAAFVQGGAKAGEICTWKMTLDQAIRDFDDVLQGWSPYL